MRRGRFSLRMLGYTIGLIFLVVVGLAAWISSRAIQVRNDLNVLRSEFVALQNALGDQSGQKVGDALADLARTTRDADQATNDPIWRSMRHIPLVGRSFVTTSGMVRELTSDVNGPIKTLSEVKLSLAPDQVRASNGTLNLHVITDAVPRLRAAATALIESNDRLRKLPHSAMLGSVVKERDKLVTEGANLAASVTSAADAAEVSAHLLGADGRRRYFVGIQDNAESRGTGGAIGAYVILRVDHGAFTIEKSGVAEELKDAPSDVVDLGPDYKAAWGKFHPNSTWSGSNRSGTFAYAAQNWIGLLKAQAPTLKFDGALALDPVMLSQLMTLTGPVQIRGGITISPDKVLATTETFEYSLINTDAKRHIVMQDITTAVFSKLFKGSGESGALVSTFLDGAAKDHFMVYSSDAAAQSVIETTSFLGGPPKDERVYSSSIINNIGGTKLDSYLNEVVAYSSSCSSGARTGKVVLRLRNNVSAKAIPLVGLRRDAKPGTYTLGQDRLLVTIYGSRGGSLTKLTLDGKEMTPTVGTEDGHPIWSVDLTVDPSQERVITADTTEPSTGARATLRLQGLAKPVDATLDLIPCT